MRLSQGDFNADGVVDGQDYTAWNLNKFNSSFPAATVPEPAAATILLSLLAGRRAAHAPPAPHNYCSPKTQTIRRPLAGGM